LIEVGAEFLAILLIMVYIGAIAVLFLFVIMLLNIRKIELNKNYINYWPVAFLISILFFAEISVIIYLKNNNIELVWGPIDYFWIKSLYYTSNTEVIGILLYNIYYHYFFFLSLILVIALLGNLILLVNKDGQDFSKIKRVYYKKKWKY
jgi:NADH-quinone oxidoreductase subunit J